ncbi:MAG: hypothetical protein AAGM22_07755 [Acidobacteriota bacterium]
MPRCYRLLWIFVLLGPLAVLPAVADAGVILRTTTTYHAEKPPRTEVTSTKAHAGSLRIDVAKPGDGEAAEGDALHSTIFRGAFGDFLIVDHGDRVFTVLDDQAIKDLEAQLQYTMLQLDRQMAELPPEQRRKMREALKGGEVKAEPEMVKTDKVEERGGLSCQLYEFRRGEELVRAVWVAPWDEVTGGKELRAALEGMQGFNARLEEAFKSIKSEALGGAQVFDFGPNPFQGFDRFDGLPVHTVEYENGEPSFETSVVATEEVELNQADFVPPSNYQRRSWAGE